MIAYSTEFQRLLKTLPKIENGPDYHRNFSDQIAENHGGNFALAQP
ncbi:hypothetical protein [Synechocystis salina]|nr:hypothetical protein [Synechocystis salina]